MKTMRAWKKALAITVLGCTLAIPGYAGAEEMMMMEKTPTGAIMRDGVELVPLRATAEALGFKVTWNGESRSVTLMKKMMMMEDKSKMNDMGMADKGMMGDKMMEDNMMAMGSTFVIHINSKMIMAGGMEDMLMYAPVLMNEMTYVPKAFIDTYLMK